MSQERGFFESMAGFYQPGWAIKLQPQLVPGAMELTSYTVLLYLVDTSTGWTAAGAMRPGAFTDATATALHAGLPSGAVADAAGLAIGRLGRAQVTGNAPELVQCLQLTVAALADTQTFRAVHASGDLAGHWIYIAYRAHDASTITRPVFLRAKGAGFLAPTALDQMVRQVVTQDIGNPHSTVGKIIKRAGGVQLATKFSAH